MPGIDAESGTQRLLARERQLTELLKETEEVLAYYRLRRQVWDGWERMIAAKRRQELIGYLRMIQDTADEKNVDEAYDEPIAASSAKPAEIPDRFEDLRLRWQSILGQDAHHENLAQ